MYRATWHGAPFAATPHHQVKAMLDATALGEGETLLDVGSGDGRIVIAAAERGAQAIGIEIQPHLRRMSQVQIAEKGLKNAQVIEHDFWQYDFGQIDVLSVFCIPRKMKKLEKKIKDEMKGGSRVVSYDFAFPTWQHHRKDGKIYIYLVE